MIKGTGIVAVEAGGTLQDELAYDSTLHHLLVDTRPGVDHVKIFETKGGLTSATYAGATGGVLNEEVWKIKHNLPFIPRVALYMLVRDAPASAATFIGDYNSRIVVAAGLSEDTVYYRVDKTHVYLLRRFEVFAVPGNLNNYSSFAQDMLLRIKYLIFNNEALDEPYDGEAYGL